jgi:lactobin A/cerein 7B family class IIb bacteriocin
MYELNEEELKQVVGGRGYAGSGFAGGFAGAGFGVARNGSNVYTQATGHSATADASNGGFAAGWHPIVVSGAGATSYTY